MNPIELRARREALGLSQQALGELLDVPQPTLSAWEVGTRSPRDPASVHLLLAELEDTLARLIDEAVEVVEHKSGVLDSAEVELVTYADDESYWRADAGARAGRVPAVLHRVAAAHAAWMAREDGASVRITPPE